MEFNRSTRYRNRQRGKLFFIIQYLFVILQLGFNNTNTINSFYLFFLFHALGQHKDKQQTIPLASPTEQAQQQGEAIYDEIHNSRANGPKRSHIVSSNAITTWRTLAVLCSASIANFRRWHQRLYNTTIHPTWPR